VKAAVSYNTQHVFYATTLHT